MSSRLRVIGMALLLSVAAWAQEVQPDSLAVAADDSLVVVTDSTIVLSDTLVLPTTNDLTVSPLNGVENCLDLAIRTDGVAGSVTPTRDYLDGKGNNDQRPSIYQGTLLKLDVGASAVVIGMTRGQIQHYELSANVRLKNRFYPTLELGYAGTTRAPVTYNDTISYQGQGGFFRVGCDLNPLKKHPESPHALIVGIRLGTAVQDYAQSTVVGETGILNPNTDMRVATSGLRGDCWGEIVAGCQVEVAKGKKPRANGQRSMAFYMGWMFRFKILFTRSLTAQMKKKVGEDVVDISPYMPMYIPGYGVRDNIGWGIGYHLGWKF